jgi:RimJ/RimL family protein N-acetyltransferase
MAAESVSLPVPVEIRTERLVMRPWRAEDAEALHPILVSNWDHLGPWIPARVATPVPVPELAQRLAGFANDFASGRDFRYGLFARDGHDVLGEAGLYPRSAAGRVPLAEADCIELGYWLRADLTGRGLVTEASRALVDVAMTLPHLAHIEIRCDARNAPSAAIPRRLGFALTSTLVEPASVPDEDPVLLQVWTSPLPTR